MSCWSEVIACSVVFMIIKCLLLLILQRPSTLLNIKCLKVPMTIVVLFVIVKRVVTQRPKWPARKRFEHKTTYCTCSSYNKSIQRVPVASTIKAYYYSLLVWYGIIVRFLGESELFNYAATEGVRAKKRIVQNLRCSLRNIK